MRSGASLTSGGEHTGGLRRIGAADRRDARRRRQRWRDVLLEAKDVRLPPVVARPADGVDGPHPVLVERARRGNRQHDVARRRREVEHVEPVHIEAGPDRPRSWFGKDVEEITARRDGVVRHGVVSVAERPVAGSGVVGEHGLPRPEDGSGDGAVLELIHRRIERRRRRVGRPRDGRTRWRGAAIAHRTQGRGAGAAECRGRGRLGRFAGSRLRR